MDSYLSIAAIAGDPWMLERIRACAAQQQIPEVETWSYDLRYAWASSPSWGEKWDYALAVHPEEEYQPGKDAAVITDGDVLATVQALKG